MAYKVAISVRYQTWGEFLGEASFTLLGRHDALPTPDPLPLLGFSLAICLLGFPDVQVAPPGQGPQAVRPAQYLLTLRCYFLTHKCDRTLSLLRPSNEGQKVPS